MMLAATDAGLVRPGEGHVPAAVQSLIWCVGAGCPVCGPAQDGPRGKSLHGASRLHSVREAEHAVHRDC